MQDQSHQPINAPTAVKIIEAATHLFMQRGYKAVSITDIIKAAEVTKPTLYYYFSDKEELFVQMGLSVVAMMSAQLRDAAASAATTAQRLTALAQVLLADRDGDMRMMRHEMFEHVGPAQRERLAGAFYSGLFAPIQQAMARGLADGELTRYPAEILAAMFLGMSESFHEFASGAHAGPWASAPGGPFSSPQLSAETLVDLFLHGVAPNPRDPAAGDGPAPRDP
ncbi:TetR/AcrR family transcriptional regulator [Oscillochloris sp. ZM17-4]|uniref:TetR/AcrR family transcriptional regulator n=1 Tax=Oscillochloris sp. ZM17-4 TaxID=2866714 RepID=UPI001C739799|nr:TetR/AcrR family transcriptional regulator [Oscillochloris sp. ZM17-4]MBX0326426.1 TetR/AcrR family transcriptional regulator [Oscillochloris sp. ZM17-4]